MPNSGSNPAKTGARRIQKALDIRYTLALRMLEAAKAENPELTWTATATLVIAEAVHE